MGNSALVWIFGFGSLTFDGWQSQFGCLSQQRAILLGYRRVFNKKSVVNWGTKENPGITLNLERGPGAKCEGVGFEFSDEPKSLAALLAYLQKREGCPPTTHGIQLAEGRIVEALAYVYEGPNLLRTTNNIAEKAALIANAKGKSGSAVDYVRMNFEGLQKAGLEDPAVTELWEAVRASNPTA